MGKNGEQNKTKQQQQQSHLKTINHRVDLFVYQGVKKWDALFADVNNIEY